MYKTLKTKRLLLRPFTIDDASQMFNAWASDKEVTKYLTWEPHQSIAETKAIINIWISEYEKPERINFAIVLNDTNTLIGGIDVVGYIDDIPVIGYCMAKDYWGKGIMTEACKEVINFLFSLGHKKIRIDAATDNIGSNRVIQKCGGKLYRTFDEYYKAKDKTFTINEYYITLDDVNEI